MRDKRLISMVEFVDEQSENMKGEYGTLDFYYNVTKYSDFLKQYLKLGMFFGKDKLFEGFDVVKYTKGNMLRLNGVSFCSENDLSKFNVEEIMTLFDENPTLTQSALKTIYG